MRQEDRSLVGTLGLLLNVVHRADVQARRGPVDARGFIRQNKRNLSLCPCFAAIDEAISHKLKGDDFIIDRRHKRPRQVIPHR